MSRSSAQATVSQIQQVLSYYISTMSFPQKSKPVLRGKNTHKSCNKECFVWISGDIGVILRVIYTEEFKN
jgi:hypothetical protein